MFNRCSANGSACRWVSLTLLLAAGILSAWSIQPRPAGSVEKRDGGAGAEASNPIRVINQQIEAQWKFNRLVPARFATDYEFIRRASLDIIGRIATPEEMNRFLRDPIQTRRIRLVQRLLDSDEFAKNWANIWTVWLMTRSAPGTYHDEMQSWLEKQFTQKDHGFDKIAHDLLTATGKSDENGAVNFILTNEGAPVSKDKVVEDGHSDFVPLTSRTARLFLGLQIQCAQCHDHPLNPQWKQKHFWGLNAFFRQVKGTRPPTRRRMDMTPELALGDDIEVNKEGAIFYEERRGTVFMTRPVFLDGRRLPKETDQSRREILAEFVLSSPYFAKAYVNRMWAHFFGRGFTNPGPPDDFGENNPVTHPILSEEQLAKVRQAKSPLPEDLVKEIKGLDNDANHPRLLDYLADQFRQSGCNPRQLVSWICNSEAYQLSTVENRSNAKPEAEPYFSRMLLKALSPEQLFESLMVATQAEAAESREGKKNLRDQWMKNLIVNFGDDEGNEVTFNGTVVQALIIMNGRELNDAIAHKEKGTFGAALRKPSIRATLDYLTLAALNRPATENEYRAIAREVGMLRLGKIRSADPTTLWQDEFWALLNSNEFMLNH